MPADYYRQAFATELDRGNPGKVLATAAIDQAARTALGGIMALKPSLHTPTARARESERAPGVLQSARHRLRRRGVPNATCQPVSRRDANVWGLGFEGAVCQRLSVESPFVPLNPELRADYARQACNRGISYPNLSG